MPEGQDNTLVGWAILPAASDKLNCRLSGGRGVNWK